jgi:hypothetical protein
VLLYVRLEVDLFSLLVYKVVRKRQHHELLRVVSVQFLCALSN